MTEDKISKCLNEKCSYTKYEKTGTCKNLYFTLLEDQIYSTCEKKTDPEEWNKCISTQCKGRNIPTCLDQQINTKCDKEENYDQCVQFECVLPKNLIAYSCHDLYNQDEVVEAEVVEADGGNKPQTDEQLLNVEGETEEATPATETEEATPATDNTEGETEEATTGYENVDGEFNEEAMVETQ